MMHGQTQIKLIICRISIVINLYKVGSNNRLLVSYNYIFKVP